jgi:hypothetical protein
VSTLDDRVALRHALAMSTTRVARGAAIEAGDADGGSARLLLMAAGPHAAKAIVREARDE